MLRGPRGERVREMLSLGKEEWSLDTLLYLHLGTHDHSEEVRMAALDALMEIVTRSPEPVTVSPTTMLTRYMFSFTVASGYTPFIFQFLVGLGTPEAIQAAENALRWVQRNEDFRKFVDVLVEAGELDVLRNVEKENLPKTKAKILRDALNTIDA